MTAARREAAPRCRMNTGDGVCIPAVERVFEIQTKV
jgi:hypothetical protein